MKQATKLATRFLQYVGIALSFLLVCALLIAIAVYTGHSHEPPVGWFGLAGFTPLVFWAVVKPLRMWWKHATFWFAVVALLVVHLLAFVAVLLYYPRWPLLWFVPVSFVEAALFMMILGYLFNDTNGPRTLR